MTAASAIERLLDIMARLRDRERGCPWDVEQTFASIAPYTIEEAYEVADAIAREDPDALRDELGDLLFQVVFHARMAEEAALFRFEDVAEGICAKMLRRHPHVFAEAAIANAAEQTAAWERHKAAERRRQAEAEGRRESALDGVSVALPALTRAVKIQSRAARVGFDWTTAPPILDKIDEETDELRQALAAESPREAIEDELGDLLFAVANLARRLDVDPESALRRATGKFERRFRRVEELLAQSGIDAADADLPRMEEAWQQAKAEGL